MSNIPDNATPKELLAILQEAVRGIVEIRESHKEFEREIRESHKKFESGMEEFRCGMAELRKSQEETALAMKETDRFLKSVGDKLSGISDNNGYFAEQYFYDALSRTKKFAGIEFDKVLPNFSAKLGKVEDEYDIVMFNGTSVAIIETKYRIHPSFLDKMILQKVGNFRTLYPKYAKHTIYLGIASFSFNDEAIRRAKELGIGILKQNGDTIEYDTENMKAY